MPRIGFIGLGNMGLPMAARLSKAGFAVAGFDKAPAAQEAAQSAGIERAGAAADAVRDAEVVITMLPGGAEVLEVYAEVLGAAPAGALFIDCSTIDGDDARTAHERARVGGMMALDAPVSGGVAGAEAGSLTFMVGGEEEAFTRAEPVLGAMGRRIVHCGGAGAGQAAKICNNLILGISMIAVSEAFALAETLGLAADRLFAVASASSGQCWSLTHYCPVPGLVAGSPANRGYTPGFATRLMQKDLRLAERAADRAGLSLALGAKAAECYARFAAAGHGEADFSRIIEAVRASPRTR